MGARSPPHFFESLSGHSRTFEATGAREKGLDVTPNIELRLRAGEALAEHYWIGQPEFVFADPTRQIEWLALLELQRKLEAMEGDSENLDREANRTTLRTQIVSEGSTLGRMYREFGSARNGRSWPNLTSWTPPGARRLWG
jgi:hypothetical protein